MSEVGHPTNYAINHSSGDVLDVLQTHPSDSAVYQRQTSDIQQHGTETAVKKPNIFLRAILNLIAWLFPKHQFLEQPSTTKIRSTEQPSIAPSAQVELIQRRVTYKSLVNGLMDKGYSLSQARQAADAFLNKIDGYMQSGLDFKQALEQLRKNNRIQLQISQNYKEAKEKEAEAKIAEAKISESKERRYNELKEAVGAVQAHQMVYGS